MQQPLPTPFFFLDHLFQFLREWFPFQAIYVGCMCHCVFTTIYHYQWTFARPVRWCIIMQMEMLQGQGSNQSDSELIMQLDTFQEQGSDHPDSVLIMQLDTFQEQGSDHPVYWSCSWTCSRNKAVTIQAACWSCSWTCCRAKAGSNQSESILIMQLPNGLALEFERSDAARRIRLILSQLLFVVSEVRILFYVFACFQFSVLCLI